MNDFEQLVKRINYYKNELLEKVEHKKKDILSQLESLEGNQSKKFKKEIKSTNELFKKIEIENKYILEIEKKNILLDQIRKNKFQKNIRTHNFDYVKYIKIINFEGFYRTCYDIIDSNTFAIGSIDKTIKIWNLNESRCIKTLEGHTNWVTCLELIVSYIIASESGDKTIKIWNLNESRCIKTLEWDDNQRITSIFDNVINDLKLLDDKNTLVCLMNKKLKIWC